MVRCGYLDLSCSRFVDQQNRKYDDLLMCRLEVLLAGGYLVNTGSRQADRYLVN